MENYVVDRVEEGTWVVLEDQAGRSFTIPRRWLPDGLREGDVLRVKSGDGAEKRVVESGADVVRPVPDIETEVESALLADPSAGDFACVSHLRFEIDPEERRRREEKVARLREQLSRGPSGDLEL